MNPKTRQELVRWDEIDAFEFPCRFDYQRLLHRALNVERKMKTELLEKTTFEDAVYNQDASFSIAICLHQYEQMTPSGRYLPCIRFSNFGDLVSITHSDRIPARRLEEFTMLLEAEGFTFLPENELDCVYDGVMPGHFATWWIRYFDWL